MDSARITGLPLGGYRFDPMDEELILQYLYNKVHGIPLAPNVVIECDLYDEEEPWREVFKESKEIIHYFFTKLKKKKNEKGSRIQRGTGCSTWKSQRDEKIHFYEEKNKKIHIGSKRNFSYVPKEGFKADGRWVMHEYRLDGFLLENKTHHNDYVLCRVRKLEKSEEDKGQQQVESITNSDINERVLETSESSESGGLQQIEHMSVNNTTGTAIATPSMIPQTPGVQQMEENMGSDNTTNSEIAPSDLQNDFDSFGEDPNLVLTIEEIESILFSSDESSPKYQATQTMSSLMEPSCLNVVETDVQTQGHASVMMSPEVSTYPPVPESTYLLPSGSNEFLIPSADTERMWYYQQQPVPMNVLETGVQTEGQVSIVSPASTYMFPFESNEFAIPSADTERMWYYQQPEPMNVSPALTF